MKMATKEARNAEGRRAPRRAWPPVLIGAAAALRRLSTTYGTCAAMRSPFDVDYHTKLQLTNQYCMYIYDWHLQTGMKHCLLQSLSAGQAWITQRL